MLPCSFQEDFGSIWRVAERARTAALLTWPELAPGGTGWLLAGLSPGSFPPGTVAKSHTIVAPNTPAARKVRLFIAG